MRLLPRLTFRQWVGYTGFAFVFLIVAALLVWRGDILRAGLDPQIPFQTYDPPAAPDYSRPQAWAMLDERAPGAGPAHVFFVHSTTFEGGKDWNSPIGDAKADAYLERVVIPNYAGPFARAGDISAPRYRQGSLYTRLTLRDDAREARAFAYRDIEAAFEAWLTRNPEGPIVLVGIEQGGELTDRLLRDRVAPDADLSARVAAVYIIDAVIAVDRLPANFEPCHVRDQAGCVVAWSQLDEGDDSALRRRVRRALVWNERGELVGLDGRPNVCVNPITGSDDGQVAPARRHLGAANATELEWGVRPAFIDRQVEAVCRDGFLRHTPMKTESFRHRGSWADRRKATPYNLFYADIEADVQARLAAWAAARVG